MAESTFNLIIWIWTSLGAVIFIVLLFITAPFGRHSSAKWGPSIPDRLGWFVMEVPALLVFSILFLNGSAVKTTASWIIASMYAGHYLNRSVIYPLRIRTRGKEMPLAVAVMAFVFNMVNAGALGYYTGTLQTQYGREWLTSPAFFAGILLFVVGMTVNMVSDNELIRLRKNRPGGYSIPYGVLFRKVSCPNFLGEIIEWGGFAIAAMSLPAFSFFVWTFCNLVPRALSHHKWYRQTFPDYPPERKAVLPFIL